MACYTLTLCISSLHQYLLLKGNCLRISEQSGSPSFMNNQCKMFLLRTCSITHNPPSTCMHVINHVTTTHTFSITNIGVPCVVSPTFNTQWNFPMPSVHIYSIMTVSSSTKACLVTTIRVTRSPSTLHTVIHCMCSIHTFIVISGL